jgi:hypothetical protein
VGVRDAAGVDGVDGSTPWEALIAAETGVQEDPATPARKAAWFADAAAWIRPHIAIRAVSYVDGISPKGYDFRVDTSSTAFAAWQAMSVG